MLAKRARMSGSLAGASTTKRCPGKARQRIAPQASCFEAARGPTRKRRESQRAPSGPPTPTRCVSLDTSAMVTFERSTYIRSRFAIDSAMSAGKQHREAGVGSRIAPQHEIGEHPALGRVVAAEAAGARRERRDVARQLALQKGGGVDAGDRKHVQRPQVADDGRVACGFERLLGVTGDRGKGIGHIKATGRGVTRVP